VVNPISDQHVVGVLGLVVTGSGPLLGALTHPDPFGLKKRTHGRPPSPALHGINLKDRVVRRAVDSYYAVKYPGTATWDRMTPQQRTLWWMNRVGRFTTLVASVPGFAGVVADRLPLQAALGGASQAVVLCAVATEWGVTDHADQVRLLAWVLCRRAVSRELVRHAPEQTDAQLKAEGLDADEERLHLEASPSLAGAAKALWRYGRMLRGIVDELDKRPQGRWPHRMLGMLPVVGIVGDYLGERSALKRAVRLADEWVRANRQSLG
jgi:hypothetical protein